ncbi:MAG: hypoxanthine phosphoribosyltransferase [Bacteroidales bacterium]|nr:hypoxanthine phosphoribosyltransferase [Bacteroidales bacterium]
MDKVIVHDKEFTLFIENEKLQQAVDQLANEMNVKLADKNPLFIVVLNGAFIFAADLIRKFRHDCETSFVKLSSYQGTKTTHTVRELIGLDEDVSGRTIVLIEDIIDTGITMDNTIRQMKNMGAAEVQVATLLFKPHAFQKEFEIAYKGMDIPNDFIVGYGLDYDGQGRHLPHIYKISE